MKDSWHPAARQKVCFACDLENHHHAMGNRSVLIGLPIALANPDTTLMYGK
jgi:hypothetical protein